jgi:hypothetical protein
MNNHVKRIKGWFKGLCLLGIPLLAVSLIVPAGNRLSKTQIEEMQSDTQLKGIATLVLAYKNQHGGAMPPSLSELAWNNDILSTFYAPNKAESMKPIGWSTDASNLDKSFDYAVPPNPHSDIVAFEKGGLWPDGTVAVCFTNLNVERMSEKVFKTLLK